MGVRHGVSEEVSMTEKRDLKRLVRERQARTGESYVTALRQIRAQRVEAEPDGAIDVIEVVHVTEVGEPLGYKCRIWCTPTLVPRIDMAATLTRFRDLLIATGRDRTLDLMRDVVLRGEKPPAAPARPLILDLDDFLARVRAGLGGVSDSGRIVAMHVEGKAGGHMVMFVLMLGWAVPGVRRQREPALGLAEVPEANDSPYDWRVLPW